MDLEHYYDELVREIRKPDIKNLLYAAKELMIEQSSKGGRVILCGNGGSSATCSHLAVDFSKQAGIPAVTYNDHAFLSALSNDRGFDQSLVCAFKYFLIEHDLIVFLSVSGESQNLINACNYAKSQNHKIITLTGKQCSNKLRALGNINFWVDSEAYNIVENCHQIWLTTIVDIIIGKAVYSV